jgi:hypothetical protein
MPRSHASSSTREERRQGQRLQSEPAPPRVHGRPFARHQGRFASFLLAAAPVAARVAPYVMLFFAFRLVLAAVAVFASWLAPDLSAQDVLARGWDGGWYLSIAEIGYPPDTSDAGPGNAWAFFPGYPLTLRWVAALTGTSVQAASVVVGLLGGVLASMGVGLFLEDLWSKPAAVAGTAAFLFFPTSFVLGMSYTEATFVASASFALWMLRRQLWIPAALVVAYGSVLRPQGAVLVAMYLVAVLVLRRPFQFELRRVAGALIAPSALLAWLAYQQVKLGTPIGFLEAQAAWGAGGFLWFTTPFRAALQVLQQGVGLANAHQVLATFGLIFMLAGVAAMGVQRRRGLSIPLYVWVFVVGTVLAAMSPFFATSVLRYSGAAFPLFGALAAAAPPRMRWPLVAGSAMTQGALATVALASFSLTATSSGTAPFVP